ncbi:hypothetical protein F1C58_16745 (plasmid) [Glaciihabitans sp. INWT7]|uniref:hypothetical protein n=1 Tax=Glaciihabitans sp. INWT7 TaxID=2596912 RepID=UPI00162A7906|nr:hypothetical protein [Glaciihabitans sp. INWT7]QNE48706.1 hypothetical protein F1C58_16745 [Glaciihabitans sp. INWT7]
MTSDFAVPLHDAEHFDALRGWARGMTTLVAATELLIRAGFAGSGRPWVRYDNDAHRPWIDFDEIPNLCGAMSGGEQRLLRIAASIGGTTLIDLGSEVAGLDRRLTELVSVAIIHAAGFTEPTRNIVWEGDDRVVVTVPPLAQWPDVRS